MRLVFSMEKAGEAACTAPPIGGLLVAGIVSGITHCVGTGGDFLSVHGDVEPLGQVFPRRGVDDRPHWIRWPSS